MSFLLSLRRLALVAAPALLLATLPAQAGMIDKTGRWPQT